MGNIQGGGLDLSDLKYLPNDHSDFPALLLQPGDLLFNRTNSAELVGKSAVYTGDPDPCTCASYIIRARLKRGCRPELVSWYLNSGFGRAWVASVVSQQVGQANVNGTKLKAFRFPLPPEREQRRIVAKADELFSKLDAGVAALQRVRENLKRYRASVLKAAVEGRLTEQWRAENPSVESARTVLVKSAPNRGKQPHTPLGPRGSTVRTQRLGMGQSRRGGQSATRSSAVHRNITPAQTCGRTYA